MNPLLDFIKQTRLKFSPRIIGTWLVEFGYARDVECDQFVGLSIATQERGPRIARELDIHAKRLADRAQMGPQRMQGRAQVIR